MYESQSKSELYWIINKKALFEKKKTVLSNIPDFARNFQSSFYKFHVPVRIWKCIVGITPAQFVNTSRMRHVSLRRRKDIGLFANIYFSRTRILSNKSKLTSRLIASHCFIRKCIFYVSRNETKTFSTLAIDGSRVYSRRSTRLAQTV